MVSRKKSLRRVSGYLSHYRRLVHLFKHWFVLLPSAVSRDAVTLWSLKWTLHGRPHSIGPLFFCLCLYFLVSPLLRLLLIWNSPNPPSETTFILPLWPPTAAPLAVSTHNDRCLFVDLRFKFLWEPLWLCFLWSFYLLLLLPSCCLLFITGRPCKHWGRLQLLWSLRPGAGPVCVVYVRPGEATVTTAVCGSGL